ncbi:MAG: diguanylate cyclase [Candidatus Gastranaerophilales bacterium]|nr:diguanylate cyclase [Candidatus Gastranaerophilales bacterium]
MSNIIPEKTIVDTVSELQQEMLQIKYCIELGKIINYAQDINTLAIKFTEFIKNELKIKKVFFLLAEDNFFKSITEIDSEFSDMFEFENNGESIWKLIEDGKPLLIIDESGKNIYSNFFEKSKLEQMEANVWLPVIFNGQIFAIISIGSKIDNKPYDEADFKLFEKIIDQLGQGINKHNSKNEEKNRMGELQKTLHNISILYNVGQALNFIDDLKRLLKVILSTAIETIGAEKGSLMLYDSYSNELVVKVVYGLPIKETEERINDGLFECTRIKVGEGIAGTAFNTRQAIITNLGSNDPRFVQSEFSNVTSILCIPLIVKEETIGIINITNKMDGKFFNQDDLEFMCALANQAAIAINNAQLYELAITDGLTKLFIFRHFHYLLDNELKRALRYRHSLSLLMLDIDNFKEINDTYGHQVGDELLRAIAETIANDCRKIDLPSRYGGEEFALILPETKKENARTIAERLRYKIEHLVLDIKNGPKFSPTVSIGISGLPDDADNKEDLIQKADIALYFAKNNGKNCVAEYSEEGCFILKGLDECEI